MSSFTNFIINEFEVDRETQKKIKNDRSQRKKMNVGQVCC